MSGDERDEALRRHVASLLEGRGAHEDFDAIVAHFPEAHRGRRAPGFTHTGWMLVEHLRIAQKDILEFSRNADWKSPEWPSGYWPVGDAPPAPDSWEASLQAFRADLAALSGLVGDAATDVLAEIPWGDGQTILREALLVADHNAYHLGQIVDLRKALGIWPPAP